MYQKYSTPESVEQALINKTVQRLSMVNFQRKLKSEGNKTHNTAKLEYAKIIKKGVLLYDLYMVDYE